MKQKQRKPIKRVKPLRVAGKTKPPSAKKRTRPRKGRTAKLARENAALTDLVYDTRPSQVMVPAPAAAQPLVAQNAYEVATGGVVLPPKQLQQLDKLPMATVMRWLPTCKTPTRFVKWRKAPGGGTVPYVKGGFVKLMLNALFPGRWSLVDVKVDLKSKAAQGKDQFVATGTLLIRHSDGSEQRISQVGTCIVEVMRSSGEPVNLGFDAKGAVTDLLKKCASELGVAHDVYASLDEDIPKQETKQQQAMSEKEAAEAYNRLITRIHERLKLHPKSEYRKDGYTAAMLWQDLANLWGDSWAMTTKPFQSMREGIASMVTMSVTEQRASYAKLRNKWLRSETALTTPPAPIGEPSPPDEKNSPGKDPASPEQAPEHATAKSKAGRGPAALFWTRVDRLTRGLSTHEVELMVQAALKAQQKAKRVPVKVKTWAECDEVQLAYVWLQFKTANMPAGGKR